jgi:endonuclease/exonuclease/phosphatase family metal-dependent hydrolase
MGLSLVTWNMQHNQASWEWLAEYVSDAGCQIALLQEAARPTELPGNARSAPPADVAEEWAIRSPIDTTGRPWTSAVVCFDLGLPFEPCAATPITQARTGEHVVSHPGQWQAASVGSRLTLASVYGLWNDLPDYAVPSVHRAISDLTHLFWGERRPMLISGDLNIWRGYGDWQAGYETVFERLDKEGMQLVGPFGQTALDDCPCKDAASCRHVATLRKGDLKRWQTDFVFAKQFIAPLVSCDPLPESWEFSDHLAIRIDIDV